MIITAYIKNPNPVEYHEMIPQVVDGPVKVLSIDDLGAHLENDLQEGIRIVYDLVVYTDKVSTETELVKFRADGESEYLIPLYEERAVINRVPHLEQYAVTVVS